MAKIVHAVIFSPPRTVEQQFAGRLAMRTCETCGATITYDPARPEEEIEVTGKHADWHRALHEAGLE